MGNPAQMQLSVTPPAVVHGAVMKAKYRTGRGGDMPLPTVSPAETSGVNMPGLQTGEIFSPVEARYESLSVDGTKRAYQQLNAVLDGLASQVVQTMERIVPYLAKMQSLLCQRGAERKNVLKKAGLPKWTQWVESYAKNLDCTVRTIQLHIKHLREGHEYGRSVQAAAAEKPVKLDARQQAALVKAQVAANDLAAALKSGEDWHSALAEYEKVAITPAKLDAYLNALGGEHETPDPACLPRYWLTPESEYALLNDEFHFDFDPCPCPKPEGFDSLNMEWGNSTYFNPPFHKWDGGGKGPTAWVRKGIEEHKKGKKLCFCSPFKAT
jgi:hypothetical protein